MRIYHMLILSFTLSLAAQPSAAQVCLVSDRLTSCEGPDCELDFEDTSTSGNDTTSSVNLDARRARVRAGKTVVLNSASAEIGFSFRSAYTMDVDFLINGSILGVIQGGAFSAFGEVRVWAGLRNVSDGTVDEVEVFSETQNSNDVMLIPQNPLEGVVREFTASLERGDEYVIYFRIRSRSRGVLANSDFASGARGLTFDRLEITFPLADSDSDGLFDLWETSGVPGCETDQILLPLHTMGADPSHKDIFVEYDWLPGRDPVSSTIEAVRTAFSLAPSDAGGTENPDGTDGITIWIDTGDATTGDNLLGGNQIPLGDIPNGVSVGKLGGDADDDGTPDFYQVKAANFDPNRIYAFHYVIGGPDGIQELGAGAGSCSDGVDNDGDGLIDNADSGDCFRNSKAELGGNDFFLNVRGSGIFMHELGHNLNLRHGGSDNRNCKPNYISVMNYSFQNGIPQDTIAGQDIDADGIVDNRIIDYSPPRFPGGRGTVPTILLDEIFNDGLNGAGLDETQILDATDMENMTAFSDGAGNPQTSGLDTPNDWSGDDAPLGNPPDDVGVTANINAGPASLCSTSGLDIEPHQPHDDWSVVQLNFLQYGDAADAPVNPTTEPEPTPEELDDLLEAIYTTDLSITKTVNPNPWVAGQEVTIRLSVENLGPNHTQQVLVSDALPEGLVPVSVPAACEVDNANVVSCDLGRLRRGDTVDVEFKARIERDLTCRGDQQFTFISNTAEVANGAGADTNPLNDRDTVRMEVLCVNYEYATKIVCGRQDDPDTLRLLEGRYGTTVNIHNPNDLEAFFFKKLALACPPVEQSGGKIFPIALDRLDYDQSLKSDCDELRDRIFGGEFPLGYIEGHLVVQSALSLDVQGVYTAAPLQGGVSTLDVEYVPERDVRPEAEIDLSVSKQEKHLCENLALPDNFPTGEYAFCLILFEVQVTNSGPETAHNVILTDTLQGPGGLFGVVPDFYDIEPNGQVIATDLSFGNDTMEIQVAYPEIASGESAIFRFWETIVLVPQTYVDEFLPEPVPLRNASINQASVRADETDLNAANNSTTLHVNLP